MKTTSFRRVEISGRNLRCRWTRLRSQQMRPARLPSMRTTNSRPRENDAATIRRWTSRMMLMPPQVSHLPRRPQERRLAPMRLRARLQPELTPQVLLRRLAQQLMPRRSE